jgi:hypothetical protein
VGDFPTYVFDVNTHTVNPVREVTSIKQLPVTIEGVLRGHLWEKKEWSFKTGYLL